MLVCDNLYTILLMVKNLDIAKKPAAMKLIYQIVHSDKSVDEQDEEFNELTKLLYGVDTNDEKSE